MKAPFLLCCLLAGASLRAEQPDVVIADFEGGNYGSWKVTGEAFGRGPASGALPGQMPVDGFLGKGLANSFHEGDQATGALTSPAFRIERKFIRFLIGGGGFPGETCVNLMVDGRIARTATGPNTQPGGSERLEPQAWDVTEFQGREATIEIVDNRKSGWGHINVDQIVQTDVKGSGLLANARIEMTTDEKYLFFPVKNGAAKRVVELYVSGTLTRSFDIELADEKPDWLAPLDVSKWRGKPLEIRVDKLPENSKALEQIERDDAEKLDLSVYDEPARAQFHFSSVHGWNNDPNGMVFSEGEYHLYFQYNPFGRTWGNMHWGHAVSSDLVHWRQIDVALYPHAPGDAAFSGSAVVDRANSSGWKTGENDLLVGAYTSTARGECIIYSNDRGRTWTEFAGNPVVKHSGRDPRLLWHQPTQQWVMAVYDEDSREASLEKKRGIAFYTSPDLKSWTLQSRIPGFYECPDLFELALDGDPSNTRWVLTAASSDYMVGNFDGKTFVPETALLKGNGGKGFYAAQTFSDEPKGRRVQIGWFMLDSRGAAFNQAMSLPLQLSLRSTADGPRLAWNPVEELATLRQKTHDPGAVTLAPGGPNPFTDVHGELLELRMDFIPNPSSQLRINIRGVSVVYDGKASELVVGEIHAAASSVDGKQNITIYADRAGLEIFTSGGLTYIPLPIIPKPEDQSVEITTAGGSVEVTSLKVFDLKSIWGWDW